MKKPSLRKTLLPVLLAALMMASLGGCIIYRGHGHYYHYYYHDD